MTGLPLLLALDLTGTFVFAVNGALTGLQAARLDIVGMVALGLVTAAGGGIVRDVLIGATPPAAFRYWPYLAVAAGGALLAFFFSRALRRFALPIECPGTCPAERVFAFQYVVTGAIRSDGSCRVGLPR